MSKTRTHKRTSIPNFGVHSRGDDIPQPWDFYILERIKNDIDPSHEVYHLAQRLIHIPVHPLPCPLVRESDDWLTTGIISGYDFMDTWDEYLNVMGDHGKILYSEFTQIPVEDRETSLPREQSGTYLAVKLQEDDREDIYLMAVIWGTGQVVVRVMDESDLERCLPADYSN